MRKKYRAGAFSAGEDRFFAVMGDITIDDGIKRRPTITELSSRPIYSASARAGRAFFHGIFIECYDEGSALWVIFLSMKSMMAFSLSGVRWTKATPMPG